MLIMLSEGHAASHAVAYAVYLDAVLSWFSLMALLPHTALLHAQRHSEGVTNHLLITRSRSMHTCINTGTQLIQCIHKLQCSGHSPSLGELIYKFQKI